MKTCRNKTLQPIQRAAFTLLELVFVIIVLGILAALAIPRMDRDLNQEAADHVLASIRYTQHLAINDFKHDFSSNLWHRRFWRIVFSTCNGGDKYYMIGSDDDMSGSVNATFTQQEAAIDPISGKPIFWENTNTCATGGDGTVSEDIFLTYRYGITNVTSSGGCLNATHIAFDHLGRPHHGAAFSNSTAADYSSYLSQQCTFTFTMRDGTTFDIHVEPETGYTWIDNQASS